MADFQGKRWQPYLDQEARERRDEILDHLQRNYDGPSDFIKQKLLEEDALSLEEKIQKFESEVEEKKEDLEKLKRIKREREEQDRLRDKKELLRDKQEKLRKISRRETQSREEIRESVEEKILSRKPDHLSDQEYLSKKSDRIDRIVEHRLTESPDVDSLVEDVQRLQRQVEELNGGRESWFMELERVEGEVSSA